MIAVLVNIIPHLMQGMAVGFWMAVAFIILLHACSLQQGNYNPGYDAGFEFESRQLIDVRSTRRSSNTRAAHVL